MKNQIELHNRINIILSKNPNNIRQKEVFDSISVNEDTKQYFFTQADEKWLDWLWKNGFLDAIKQKTDDPTQYSYRMPELGYLTRVVEKEPDKVAKIINSVKISQDNFNPEVIDRFLWIISALPAEQIKTLTKKIRDERWGYLMRDFNKSGHEFTKIVEKLAEEKEFNALLELAQAIFDVKRGEEISEKKGYLRTDKLFYIHDINASNIFEALANIDEEYTEKVLKITTDIIGKIIKLSDDSRDGVFDFEDPFTLFDVDFFTLEVSNRRNLSYDEDVKNLIAVIKEIIEKTIKVNCSNETKVKRLFEYIDKIPSCRSMWRLRLFVLAQCPEIFKKEIKEAFFRLFEVERYHEIISGAEYEKTLQKGFSVLSKNDRREYIKKVIEYFTKKDQEKKSEKEDWHLKYGSQILSMIPDGQITKEEKQKAKEAKFDLNSEYKPEPSVGRMRGGMVQHQSPINLGDFTIDQIIQKLKTNLVPKQLKEKYKNDDFLNPHGAEGLGDVLKEDVTKRASEYLKNICKFFDREDIHSHYLYSVLRGVQEVLRENRIDTNDINWDNLIALCILIKDSGEIESFNREKRERDSLDAWLIGWTGVHSAMTDVIQELLKENDGRIVIDFHKYRDQLFEIIGYLLRYSDPTPEDEKIETAKSKTKSPGDSDYLVTDPFTMAINTVRGRAFQAFVLFVYQDGKEFDKDKSPKISPDVKRLYEAVLKNENTRALMFMFGHYFPSFYFRDKEWIRKLLSHIFPRDLEKRYLSTAAWEGYLSTDLYEELFFDIDIQGLYEQSLALTDAAYPKQKHFREPDEGIATHLALAFVHYKEFGFEHPLFKAFWENDNPTRHARFVSFIGRSFVSGDNAKLNEFLKKEPRSKERLRDFWDWILKNYGNKEPFVEFGFWISLEKDIFELIWLAKHVRQTLEKTNGALDYEYGLIRYIVEFAEKAPEDALGIARLYLFKGGVHETNHRISFHIDKEWFEAFKILYNNSKTKSGTYALIDDLIREGGSIFWGLKKIIDNNESRGEVK